MTITTKADAINAAMSVAEDVAQGRLSPAALEAQAVTECRELFANVVGPGDPLWETQADVARQAIALGALSADELGEWAAVFRQLAGEPVSTPDPDDTAPEPITLPSVALSVSDDESEPAADPEPVAEVVAPPPPPQRQAGGYDPLAGFNPGGTRRY